MTDSVYKSRAWLAVRPVVLERDRWLCQIRLPGCKERATAVDHIIELSAGGDPYDLSNLQAACGPCNSSKARRRAKSRGSVRVW